jgi:hypothetical protein
MAYLPHVQSSPDRSSRLISYRPWSGDPYLIGHADVSFDGWIIHRIPIFRRKDGTLNVGVPDTVVLDRDGTAKKLAGRPPAPTGGRLLHSPQVSIATDDDKTRWRNAVLSALAEGGAP